MMKLLFGKLVVKPGVAMVRVVEGVCHLGILQS